METLLTGSIELSSVLDYFSDWYILIQLSKSTDTSWFSFMLLTMILPYYTVYSSLMTFKIVDIRKKKLSKMKKLSCYEQFKVFIMILPTMLGLMAAMDVLFMVFNLLIFAFMVIFICFPIRDKVHHFHEDWHNRFFMYCFGMSVMDVRGFKC